MPAMSTYLKTFKRGDIVDIVANSAIHKGMPYKHYHVRALARRETACHAHW